MDEAMEELVDTVGEFTKRVAGRSLTPAERLDLGRLIDRLDGVRATLASVLATSPSEAMRLAMAGHDRGQTAGRAN